MNAIPRSIRLLGLFVLLAGGMWFGTPLPSSAQSSDEVFVGESELTVDLTVNGSDAPEPLRRRSRITLEWTAEEAQSCQGDWSKKKLKTEGKQSGRVSKSRTFAITCTNAEGDTAQDSVVVTVGQTSVPASAVVSPPPQGTGTRTMTQSASYTTPATGATTPNLPPSTSITWSKSVRTFILDTKGNTLAALQKDMKSDGELRELANGQVVQTWKIEYEKKGGARGICDPPMFNISFDKRDREGRQRELFTGKSTYSGRPKLQYQKVRFVPLCDPEYYFASQASTGFGGKIDPHLREYAAYGIFRALGVPTVDVIGFGDVSFVSPDAKYQSRTFRYMLLQRDNEKDDELPFTEQFNLEPDLIEDGKNSASTGSHRLSQIITVHPPEGGMTITATLDAETAVKAALLAAFLQNTDGWELHNEDYGRVRGTNIWKTIPLGFDWTFETCTVTPAENQWFNEYLTQKIAELPAEKQSGLKAVYYRAAQEIFGNSASLEKMLSVIDRYPLAGEEELLKQYIKLAFYNYGVYFSSQEFATYAGAAHRSFTPAPFRTQGEYAAALQSFNVACGNQTLKPSHAAIEIIKSYLETVYITEWIKPRTFARASFIASVTAPAGQEVHIRKKGVFKAVLRQVGDEDFQQALSSSDYRLQSVSPESAGPDHVIAPGKSASVSVSFIFDPSIMKKGSRYYAELSSIEGGQGFAPIAVPPHRTNDIFISGPNGLAENTKKMSLLLRVNGEGVLPDVYPNAPLTVSWSTEGVSACDDITVTQTDPYFTEGFVPEKFSISTSQATSGTSTRNAGLSWSNGKATIRCMGGDRDFLPIFLESRVNFFIISRSESRAYLSVRRVTNPPSVYSTGRDESITVPEGSDIELEARNNLSFCYVDNIVLPNGEKGRFVIGDSSWATPFTLIQRNLAFATHEYTLMCGTLPVETVKVGVLRGASQAGISGQASTITDPAGGAVSSGTAAGAPTVDLKVNGQNSATVSPNSSLSLSWTSTNAVSCTSQNVTLSGTSGSVQASAGSTNKTFTITCSGYGGTASDSVAVSIYGTPTPTPVIQPTVSLTINSSANDFTLSAGQEITPEWSSTNASYCTNNWGSDRATYNRGRDTLPAPTVSTTYTLTCYSSAGASVSDSVTVNLQAAAPASITTPTSDSLSFSLLPSTDDRAGAWNVFGPGFSGNTTADWNWSATLSLSEAKTLRSMEVRDNTGQVWSTSDSGYFPLVVYWSGVQQNRSYGQQMGPYEAGTYTFTLYAQKWSASVGLSTLRLTFTDNTTLSATSGGQSRLNRLHALVRAAQTAGVYTPWLQAVGF